MSIIDSTGFVRYRDNTEGSTSSRPLRCPCRPCVTLLSYPRDERVAVTFMTGLVLAVVVLGAADEVAQ